MTELLLQFIGNNGFAITLVIVAILLFGSSVIGPIDDSPKKKGK